MKHIFLALSLCLTALTASQGAAQTGWNIATQRSSLYFVSTKKQHVAERHVVQGISGTLSPNGDLRVEIDLATHSSGVGIRDGRIRDLLFRVASFPKATFVGEVDMQEFADLAIGDTMTALVEGDLTLVGIEGFMDFEVAVTRVREDRVQVTSLSPAIVDSADFEIDTGIDALRNLAKLSAISYSVPVTFMLSFERG